ncbi:hypothetical protein GA0115243_1012119 [Streptomyces sp. ScaeMP-e83]|nr:hypothetical protein GA0115243_1012119 [Streptomyces sp. ScaeMP-e83]
MYSQVSKSQMPFALFATLQSLLMTEVHSSSPESSLPR